MAMYENLKRKNNTNVSNLYLIHVEYNV